MSWAMVVVLSGIICNYDPRDLTRSQMFLMGNWRGELLWTISEEWKWNTIESTGDYKIHLRQSECIMWLFRVWWVFAPSLCAYERSSANFHNHENQFCKSLLLINAFLHSNRSIKIEPRHLFLVLLHESFNCSFSLPGNTLLQKVPHAENRGLPKNQKSDLNRLQRSVIFPPLWSVVCPS